MTTIRAIQSDKLFDLNFTLQSSDGTAFNLTGATLKFKAQLEGDPAIAVDGTMAIISAAAGTCKYTVQANDLIRPGKYNVQIEATISTAIVSWGDTQLIVDPKLPKTP